MPVTRITVALRPGLACLTHGVTARGDHSCWVRARLLGEKNSECDISSLSTPGILKLPIARIESAGMLHRLFTSHSCTALLVLTRPPLITMPFVWPHLDGQRCLLALNIDAGCFASP